MSRPGYEKVIQGICTLAGAKYWQEVAENGVLCIDGVQMQIQPDGYGSSRKTSCARRLRPSAHRTHKRFPAHAAGQQFPGRRTQFAYLQHKSTKQPSSRHAAHTAHRQN